MASDQSIERSLADYIVNEVASRPPAGEIGPDFPLIEGGLIDSMGLFKLVAYIEEQFNVQIPPDEILFENFATIGLIGKLIRSKLAAPA